MRTPARSATAALASVVISSVAALTLAACGGGTVVVTGSDGAVASVGPSGEVSVSSSDGSVVVGKGSLPDGWPSDVGQPEGFTVQASADTTVDGKQAYTASFTADGDQSAAVDAWITQLEASGYTQEAGFGGGSGAGRVTALKNATTQVTVISTVADGKTGLVVNVGPVRP